ncbi:MAG: DegV family protein [Eubacterium sp.]
MWTQKQPPGLTLIVKITAINTGRQSFEGIVNEITEYTKKVKVFFILESMDNLIKNGRVNAIAGKLAGILGIKIMGGASDRNN